MADATHSRTCASGGWGSDGSSASGELKTLDSLGISSINLEATVGTGTDNGNLVGLTSTYETTDGATHAAADVWFVAEKSAGAPQAVATVDEAIAALGSAPPVGAEADGAPAVEAAGVVELPAQQTKFAVSIEPKTDLRSRVSSLAQAIGQFSDSGVAKETQNVSSLDLSGSLASANSVVSMGAASMADVMKQFDANGNMLAKPGTTAVSPTKSLNLRRECRAFRIRPMADSSPQAAASRCSASG